MNAIVMNTLTGAVSEYTGFDFHGITPSHAGNALGLYALGGDTDLGQPIVGRWRTSMSDMGDPRQKRLEMIYAGLVEGTGAATISVHATGADYTYQMPFRLPGMCRAAPGKGIRENYLAFSFSKPDGLAFTLDSFEVVTAASSTRRI